MAVAVSVATIRDVRRGLRAGGADALTRKAIELALAGDTAALRLCLERILLPRKDRPLHFRLPLESGPLDPAGAMRASWGR
jgi:hypothetical protein